MTYAGLCFLFTPQQKPSPKGWRATSPTPVSTYGSIFVRFTPARCGRKKIYRGIERSEVIVVCLSPDAVTSEWVQREVNARPAKRIRLFCPVMAINALDALQATDTMRWLLDVHFINFEQRYEEGFPELLSALPGKRRVNTYDDIDPEKYPQSVQRT